MEEQIKRWLFDPTVGKLIAALISLGIVYALRRLAQRSLGRYVTELDTRYRVRKFVTFLGYLISIAVLATIFSDRLGGLTVAFGVAGDRLCPARGDRQRGRVGRGLVRRFLFLPGTACNWAE